jgi:hypothetical protein
MSARTRSVSAIIRLVSAPPALRIDVGPDPHLVLLLRSSSGSGPVLLLLDPLVIREAASCGTARLTRVIGTRVRALRGRTPAARRAPSEDTRASLLRGWMVAAGWTC